MSWLYIIALDTFINASKYGRSVRLLFCFGRNAAKIAVVKIAPQKDPIVFKSETGRFNLSLC